LLVALHTICLPPQARTRSKRKKKQKEASAPHKPIAASRKAAPQKGKTRGDGSAATAAASQDVESAVPGTVTVKYSHYTHSFDTLGGELSWTVVEEEFCLPFAFKGAFQLELYDRKPGEKGALPVSVRMVEKEGGEEKEGDEGAESRTVGAFWGLENGAVYWLHVVEDPREAEKEALAAAARRASAPPQECGCPMKGKRAVGDLSGELRSLSVEELKERGDSYKLLVEARDLEDLLFGGMG
jgi:hypothetical protein